MPKEPKSQNAARIDELEHLVTVKEAILKAATDENVKERKRREIAHLKDEIEANKKADLATRNPVQ